MIVSPSAVDGASESVEVPSELVHLLQELEKSLIAMGAVDDALRRSGGDLDIAVRFLVEDARNRLQRQVEESLRDFSNWLRLRAQSLPLRLFVDHLDTLAEAIEQRVQQLSSSSQPANAQLERLRRDLGDFELLGLTPQVERLRREIVEFEARHKLLGDLISILRKAIAVVQEWRAKAEEVRRFLFALDRKVREELQSLPEPPEGTNFNNLKDLDALRTYLHERAYSLVKQKLPWDGTTDSDLQFIIESICDALLEDVPAVAIDKWLSENEVRNLLKRLPIWAGIGEEKALLFNLPKPFIWAEVPQAIRKPIEEQIDSGLVTISDNSSVLIVHIFKHHPIQAIEDWEEWQLADEKVRQASGGFAINSAEPFAGEGDDVGT
ncbi:MAG: hypothetical protein YPKNTGVA_001846 [Candidatus Fervidibacter sp.]|jgi:prefoldin subunit 5